MYLKYHVAVEGILERDLAMLATDNDADNRSGHRTRRSDRYTAVHYRSRSDMKFQKMEMIGKKHKH